MGRVANILQLLLRGGGEQGRAEYVFTRWLFLRLLALVYLIAFVSFWVQVDGLIGSEGILPAVERMDGLRSRLAEEPWWLRPTVCWLGAGDAWLHGLCAAGTLLSIALLCGFAPLPTLLLLWLGYLSLFHVAGPFLGFQWDILLLETGLLATFLAPPGLVGRWPFSQPAPSRIGVWLIRLLLFKLMFLSGAGKLLVLDETWWNLTALEYHYFTQPLPAWTSWYAHHLPAWVHRISVVAMFVIELVVPFFIFTTRRLRIVAALSITLLMALIGWTGNYNYFNLLTVVLCVMLLDDALLLTFVPQRARQRFRAVRVAIREAGALSGCLQRGAVAAAAGALVGLSAVAFVGELAEARTVDGLPAGLARVFDLADRRVLEPTRPLRKALSGFRCANGYGLFRGMGTRRPEIVIEASRDGRTWQPLEFRWKPGAPDRRPRFVQPHQPRLDWQMWFAALRPNRNAYWLERLARRLLQGAPPVYGLLAPTVFRDDPPRHVRFAFYSYEFSSPAERRETGHWWNRRRLGESRSFSAASVTRLSR